MSEHDIRNGYINSDLSEIGKSFIRSLVPLTQRYDK
jgi:hypothetical protein